MSSSFASFSLDQPRSRHRLIDGEFCGDERGQDRSINSGTAAALPRKRLAGFHVPFQRREDAIKRDYLVLLFGFPFCQGLGNAGKPHQPPAILLALQTNR